MSTVIVVYSITEQLYGKVVNKVEAHVHATAIHFVSNILTTECILFRKLFVLLDSQYSSEWNRCILANNKCIYVTSHAAPCYMPEDCIYSLAFVKGLIHSDKGVINRGEELGYRMQLRGW